MKPVGQGRARALVITENAVQLLTISHIEDLSFDDERPRRLIGGLRILFEEQDMEAGQGAGDSGAFVKASAGLVEIPRGPPVT
jgi:hypothetical protein